MTPRPDDHPRVLLGAFVLEQLPEHEATAVRAHLDGCPVCREEADALGSVAALLPLVDPERLGAPAEPPPRMLDEVLLRIERQRETRRRARRRSFAAWVGIAAALVLALVAVVMLRPSSTGDASVVALTAHLAGVRGEAVVHDDPDATWVELKTSGLSAGQIYAVWLEETGTRDRAPMGTFTAVEGDLYISLYSTLPRDRAAAIGVSSRDGSTVMEGPVPVVAPS
jgi:anti-sigma-K factor RskA